MEGGVGVRGEEGGVGEVRFWRHPAPHRLYIKQSEIFHRGCGFKENLNFHTGGNNKMLGVEACAASPR